MGAPAPKDDPPPLGMAQARPSATMSSRKIQAMDFIKRYFAQWGHSPTLGELAAALGVSTKRSHELVHQLAEERMIHVVAGKTRGISLVEREHELSEGDVLVMLARMGWTIGAADRVVQPPGSQPGPAHALSEALIRTLTDRGLHSLPTLDHDPDDQTDQAGNDGSTERQGPHAAETDTGGQPLGAGTVARRARRGKPRGLGPTSP